MVEAKFIITHCTKIQASTMAMPVFFDPKEVDSTAPIRVALLRISFRCGIITYTIHPCKENYEKQYTEDRAEKDL